MTNDFARWAERHPKAALDLLTILNGFPHPPPAPQTGSSEAWATQQDRRRVAEAGGLSFRNNVFSTPAKTEHTCPSCRHRFVEKHRPIRCGLANDSHQLNQRFKSPDLILLIPRRITCADVGRVVGQLGGSEEKRPGWRYTGKGPEPGQAAFLSLLESRGAYGRFNTGNIDITKW